MERGRPIGVRSRRAQHMCLDLLRDVQRTSGPFDGSVGDEQRRYCVVRWGRASWKGRTARSGPHSMLRM